MYSIKEHRVFYSSGKYHELSSSPPHVLLLSLPRPSKIRRDSLSQKSFNLPPMRVCVHACVRAFSVVSDSLRPHGMQPARLLCPWDFPGNNTGVGCHFLLPGIFLTQRSNLNFLYWQAGSLLLGHKGRPSLPQWSETILVQRTISPGSNSFLVL